MSDKRPIQFHFDWLAKTYEGWTDGTYWNGWPKVWVCPAVLERLVKDLDLPDARFDPYVYVAINAEGTWHHRVALLRAEAKAVGPDGLVLLDGWTTNEGPHED